MPPAAPDRPGVALAVRHLPRAAGERLPPAVRTAQQLDAVLLPPPAWAALFGSGGTEDEGSAKLQQNAPPAKRHLALSIAPRRRHLSVYEPQWHDLVVPAVSTSAAAGAPASAPASAPTSASAAVSASASASGAAPAPSETPETTPVMFVSRRLHRLIGSSVSARALEPIPIAAVVLATPTAALLSEATSQLSDHLFTRVLRQGQVVRVPLSGSSGYTAPVRVVMTEPVLQGVVTPKTQVTLTLAPPGSCVVQEDEEDDDRQSILTESCPSHDRASLHSNQTDMGQELDDETEGNPESSEEEEDLFIDEHFLAQTLTKLEPSPLASPDPVLGHKPPHSSTTPTLSAHVLPGAHIMEAVLSTWAASGPNRSRNDVDEQAAVLVPESQLALVGCLHGQYALLSPAPPRKESAQEASPRERLVQVFGAPSSSLPAPAQQWPPSLPLRSKDNLRAFLSPLLYSNLFAQVAGPWNNCQPDTNARPSKVHLVPLSPSMVPNGQPPIPFAEQLTLARVASAASVDKAHEPLFITALRSYFANHRRIVLQGDLIAVALNGRAVRWVGTASAPAGNSAAAPNTANGQESSIGGASAGTGAHTGSTRGSDSGPSTTGTNEEEELDIASLALPGESQRSPIEYALFRVASATADLDPTSLTSTSSRTPVPGTDAAKLNAASQEEADTVALRSRAWNGALGVLVDPGLTQIVQAGLVHAKIPAMVGKWLGVDEGLPPYPDPESALRLPDSPLTQLQSLLRAALHPAGAKVGIHVTALLSGARGSGKRTTALWAAQSMGVHVVIIDCYALVADSTTRTEGILRARLERSKQTAPAVILLHGIEALGSKAQATQDGHEPTMTRVLADCLEGLKVFPPAEPDNKTPEGFLEAATSSVRSGSIHPPSLANHDTPSALKTKQHHPLVVLATTSESEKCPSGLLALFKHTVQWNAPNEQERLSILEGAISASSPLPPPSSWASDSSVNSSASSPPSTAINVWGAGSVVLAPDVTLPSLATQTAALVAADLADLVARAKVAATARIRSQVPQGTSLADVLSAGVSLTGSDFDAALSSARATYSESIGAPKIPNVTWDDVGGLAAVKHDILDTIQLPLERPDLFADGLKKRSGVLLYGPPGTGKTLLAKAVATSCSLNFFSVKGPELLNMYIGESEANVRRVFQKARDATPCVIFFDELDSVAPKRGNQGDSGGVMDRIVSQLLAELDGMAAGGGDVFVIGATNRPDLLDPALLRPGRFDKLLYLSVAETHEAQKTILQALTRKFRLDPDLGDLTVIADQCPFNLTGADFYALASDAMLKAMTRKANEVDEKIARLNDQPGPHAWPTPLTAQYYLSELATRQDYEVSVNRADFELALKELVPSVSEDEMAHYRAVRAKFEDPDKNKKNEKDSEEGRSQASSTSAANPAAISIDLSSSGLAAKGQNQLSILAQAAQNGDVRAVRTLQTILASGDGPASSISQPVLGPSTGQPRGQAGSPQPGQLAAPIMEVNRPGNGLASAATESDVAVPGAAVTNGTLANDTSSNGTATGPATPVTQNTTAPTGTQKQNKGKGKGKGKSRAG